MKTLEIILDKIYKVKEQGYEIEKLVIPFRIQKQIAFELFPNRPGEEGLFRQSDIELINENGLIQFYGYPVEDGERIQIVRKDKPMDSLLKPK